MKQFKAPTLTIVDGYSLEPVYASSGSETGGGGGGDPQGDWTFPLEFANHNTGHHSELKVIGVHKGDNSGEGITLDIILNSKPGFACKLDYIKDNSGYCVSNVSEQGFTIYRNGHFNPIERFEFTIQVVFKDSPYEGSYVKTGQVVPCPFSVASFVVC